MEKEKDNKGKLYCKDCKHWWHNLFVKDKKEYAVRVCLHCGRYERANLRWRERKDD